MYLKSEFKRRLSRLEVVLSDVLENDGDLSEGRLPALLPALFSVYSYLWQNSGKSFLKKSYSVVHGLDDLPF